MGRDLDLAIAGLGDLHVVAQVADAAFDLDAVVQELLEGGDVKDLVVGGLRAVDGVLSNPITLVLCGYLHKTSLEDYYR